MGVDLTAVREKFMESKPLRAICSFFPKLRGALEPDTFDFDISDLCGNDVLRKAGIRNVNEMIEFLTKQHFAQIECIFEGIEELRSDRINNAINSIRDAESELALAKMAAKPEDKKKHYELAWQKSKSSSCLLISELENVINSTRNCDSVDKAVFLFKSLKNLTTTTNNNKQAKRLVYAVVRNYMIMQASALGTCSPEIIRFCPVEIARFKEKLLGSGCAELMKCYDDKGSDFWDILPDKLQVLITDSAFLVKRLTTSDEEESDINYEDVIF